MRLYREWHAYWRIDWTAEEKADFRAKYLTLHVAGNPEATIGDLRLPWEPADDD